ncbi:RPA-related protein RADX [Triplophysa tibetana]|uniref:RPA-related protein RADX n=1 Tax=Triplophysa tibetana TaxID=1572043 RepID=A0A5A9P431_9TELE|nr:RPA-related protein RADX [Triplophysa tibetana]
MAGSADRSDSGSGSILHDALQQLSGALNLSITLGSPLSVAVIAVDRYLSLQPTPESYSYDLTVTDGLWRVKFQLADSLIRWVKNGSLRCGVGVRLSRLSVVHDETRLGHSYLRIDGINSITELPEMFDNIKDVDNIPQWFRDDVIRTDGPLQLTRKHYLSLWINDDPHGSVWIANSPPPHVVLDVSNITLLGDLEAFLHCSKRPLPLLVRILHRSRIRYYGKPGQNIDFPFQVYYEVADQSGIMSMVLWNELCPEWFHRLTVGTVLYLQQFAVKPSYQKRSRPQISNLSLMTFRSIEISLNPRSPATVVTVVPPKCVQPQWYLPDVPYNFTTRSEVEANSNHACDIIGLVTYVGRLERIRSKEKSGPEKFWAYRWVHAVDGTSDSPFILEIFSSSQPEIFSNICPMTYLVCTQMRVCQEAGRFVYLTSSAETQLFITGCHKKQPYVNEPKVKAFIQWTKTLKDSVMLQKTAVGGHYSYPPAPPTFTPTTKTNTANETSIIAVAELKGELESMQYREHKRVAIQGYVVAVKYHSWPPGDQQPGVNAAQETSQSHQQQEVSNAGSFRHHITIDSTSTDSDSAIPPKRKRLHSRVKQRQYFTRSKVQSDSQDGFTSHVEEELSNEAELEEDESESEDEHMPIRHSAAREVIDPRLSGSPDAQAASQPAASWESSIWPLVKQNVTDHFCCGRLDEGSIAEKFHFDDREVLLQHLSLCPAKWTPDLTPQTHTHTPVACPGYFILTILGLNQKAAVDILFLPVVTLDDPRAAGVPHSHHDNSLLSCLTTGHVYVEPDGTCPDPGSLMSSAPQMESERVVCIIDLCLLGENRIETICSKLYRTADICQPEST